MVVKICGLQTVEAAQVAIESGADFVGVICVPNRKRTVDAEVAKSISKLCSGKSVKLVGVFRNQAKEDVAKIARDYRLDVVQLHGDEDWKEYDSFVPLPIIKRLVFPRDVGILSKLQDTDCQPLFDSEAGGTGEKLNWQSIGKWYSDSGLSNGYILAGGLNPDNVKDALKVPGVIGVDVSGGVESDGVKDSEKIQTFLRNARSL
ncbi:bifunctional tryptophan synthase trp1 [Zygosaccharomyces mellis]|uniref:N-(5'-phosphoribosyl)anthranilate isomerase n=1 Tax=Zygosaccharomyces mellis TaxID=42258 RepID=A0A4C2EBF7_9SACH|nr:bifunctional tryptophan synthase trp1 [Zygosaccharomyces mellis]